ncbi:hypothetical protein SO802_027137 [Lithocarpus litseifolius]|uniref:Uncharacterized protein n=1 Tax=Lithocarpus litseifolius TaxID=425828 RepID=A0AAW2C3L0_9ROSI
MVYITIWTIWLQQNQVIHEGKQVNPLENLLTSKSLLCKYREAYTTYNDHGDKRKDGNLTGCDRNWQLLIKIEDEGFPSKPTQGRESRFSKEAAAC